MRTRVPTERTQGQNIEGGSLSGLENSKTVASSAIQESAPTYTTDISWDEVWIGDEWNDGWSFEEWNDDWSSVGWHEGWDENA